MTDQPSSSDFIQASRVLKVKSPLGEDQLLPERMVINEGVLRDTTECPRQEGIGEAGRIDSSFHWRAISFSTLHRRFSRRGEGEGRLIVNGRIRSRRGSGRKACCLD